MGKTSIRALFLCLLVLSLLAGPLAWAAQPDQPPRTISVAIGQSFRPFCFTAKNGLPAGWLVDLWELWSQKTGVKVRFVAAPFVKTLEMIKTGQVDAHAGLFRSRQRAKYLRFAAPLANSEVAIFFHRDLFGISRPEDLSGFLVGVIQGDSAQQYLKDKHPGLRLTTFADYEHLLLAAKRGDIKVFVSDTAPGLSYLKESGLLEEFRFLADHPLQTNPLYAATQKGQASLASLIKEGFAKITESERRTIEHRWTAGVDEAERGSLVVAAVRGDAPFTWLTNSGRPAGILVDLWRLWATKTGVRVTFLFGDQAESVNFLLSGRAQVHAGLFKTPREADVLEYSLPLYPVEINLFYNSKRPEPAYEKMAGKHVGALFGTGDSELVAEKIPGVRVVAYTNMEDMLADLALGELDGLAGAGIGVEAVCRRLGLLTQVARHPRPLAVRNLYAGVKRERGELIAMVNQGLGRIPQKEIVDIENHWVVDPRMRRFRKLVTQLHLTPEEKVWLAGRRNIRLGMDMAHLPFEGVDSRGRYEGMSVDYVALLNKKLGLNMRPAGPMRWDEVLRKARSKEVDVAPCINPTAERSGYLSFTRPYLIFPNVVVTKEDHGMLSGLAGLTGGVVAVIRGYAVGEYIRQRHPGIKLLETDSLLAGLKAVLNGDARAFVETLPAITYCMRKNGLKGLKVAATTQAEYRLSFGVRKDWPQLLTILEKALQSIGEEEHKAIASRWINVRFSKETDWSFLLSVALLSAVVMGAILAVIIIWNRRLAREVNQRRRAEEELGQSQNRYASITSNVPGVVYRRVLTAEGKIEYPYVSEGFEAIYGMTAQQAADHPEDLLATIHPEDRERFMASLHRSAETMSPWELEFRVVPPHGRETWMRGLSKVHARANGDKVWDGILLDITDRKKAEERIQVMAANVPGALVQLRVSHDGNWEYLYLSPKCVDFFGQPPEAVIAKRMRLPWHPDDQPRVDEHFRKARENRSEINLVGRTINPDGQVRWTRVNLSLTNSNSDEVIYNGFLLDITERKLAEMEYLSSERKIKAMSQAVDDALIMIDGAGRVLFWNPAAERLFGFSEEEAMGMDFHSMAVDDEELSRQVAQGLKRFAATGQGRVLGVTTEVGARNRKGERFPVEVTLSSFEMDGQWYAVGTVRDISERKRAEAALRQSREEFRIIADYTYDWEGWHDKDGDLLWVNPAVERMTGHGVAECLTMPDYPRPLIHPDDFHVWRTCMEKARRGEMGNEVPFRLAEMNGVSTWVILSWNPVLDKDGVFTGFRTSARDFTKRKAVEDEIKKTTEQYTKLITAMPDAVTKTDFEGRVTYISPHVHNVYGITDEERVMGKNCLNFVHPDYVERAKAFFLGLLAPGGEAGAVSMEYLMLKQNGETFWGSLSVAVLRDPDGTPSGLLIVTRDTSEQKKAERQLLESQQRLDLALEGGNLGTWDSDFLKGTTIVDERWAKLLGLDYAILKDPFAAWIRSIHQEDLEEVRRKGRQYRDGLIAEYEVSYRVILADGRERWQVSRGKAVGRDGNGRVTRMVGTVMDITEQKLAQEMLAESQQRLDLALTASNTGMWDWRPLTGEDYHNEQWYRQLGYTSKDFPPDANPLGELMHPDDKPGFSRAMADYSSGKGDQYQQEFRMKAKGGSWRWILSLGRVTERDETGRPTRVVGVHLDITERKENEQELAASRQRLGQIIDFLPDPTWVIDVEGRVVAWNRAIAELTGILEEDILGKGDHEYALPFYGERRPCLIDMVTEPNEIRMDNFLELKREAEGKLVAESFHPGLNGGTYLASTARSLQGPGGKLVGAIETLRDVSERKKTEEELKRYVDELERFSRLVVGREEKMILLKEEINDLLGELDRDRKYKIVH